ncbi:hypothetical protein Btru_013683 [Bulinus truncatus]|nr:hypothetical protein Btru_013683 [Bulinus truncatus]
MTDVVAQNTLSQFHRLPFLAPFSFVSAFLGKKKDSCGKQFWDVVVITTADAAQEEAFQLQINQKKIRNELPIDLPIHIVSDPEGIRIGNGGSTFTALEFLEEIYGDKMYEQKILMIHAGGWSQRMPSSTVLGKIFSLLPHGSPPYQMLDLKLALYWPLVDKIGPGVFLVCADDFVVYSFGTSNEWTIPENGFTALAHPSSIDIGRTHGVFVVSDDIDKTMPADVKECFQALQKPNDEQMIRNGALLNGDSHKFAGGINIEGKAVYSDSSFYFGIDVMKKLLKFKKSEGSLNCEIDAYGDFLQAVGSRASSDYINHIPNVSQVTSNLIRMRERVFQALNGSDFHVLILNASAFVHIGTAKELIYHFCEDGVFKERMDLKNNIFNAMIDTNKSERPEYKHMCDDLKISSSTCLMHSIINIESVIEERCVIEYCDLEVPIQIMLGCIVSNCQLIKREVCLANHGVPQDCFLHTIPVKVDNETKYLTVFFKTDDDLKKSASLDAFESLRFINSDIGHFLKTHRLKAQDILPSKHDLVISSDRVNLWNLKLYPAKQTMTSSLECAISSLSKISSLEESLSLQVNNVGSTSEIYFSLADIINSKDVRQMLEYRKALYDRISLLYPSDQDFSP